MITGINHIGLAVTDLDAAVSTFQKIFQIADVHRERVEDQKIEVASINVGGVLLEFTSPTSPDSPIAKFIEKNGGRGGIQHIAFTSDDVNKEIEHLTAEGVQMLDNQAKPGAHEMMIAFMHPKSTASILTEICQQKI